MLRASGWLWSTFSFEEHKVVYKVVKVGGSGGEIYTVTGRSYRVAQQPVRDIQLV